MPFGAPNALRRVNLSHSASIGDGTLTATGGSLPGSTEARLARPRSIGMRAIRPNSGIEDLVTTGMERAPTTGITESVQTRSLLVVVLVFIILDVVFVVLVPAIVGMGCSAVRLVDLVVP